MKGSAGKGSAAWAGCSGAALCTRKISKWPNNAALCSFMGFWQGISISKSSWL